MYCWQVEDFGATNVNKNAKKDNHTLSRLSFFYYKFGS